MINQTFFHRLFAKINWNIWRKANQDLISEIAPFFDETWYRSTYPDVEAARIEPLEHYIQYGAAENRAPNPDFDPVRYLELHPEAGEGGLLPLQHWLRNPHLPTDTEERATQDALKALFDAEFDRAWYLEAYPDVARAGVDPLDDYLHYGSALGRNPNAEFQTDLYLRRYPDVSAAGLHPFAHWLTHGRAEGRAEGLLASDAPHHVARDLIASGFDSDWYVSYYTGQCSPALSPLEDYIRHGAARGRNPRADFDRALYIARYPDLDGSDMEPFYHWLRYGRAEGRQAGAVITSHDIAAYLDPKRPLIVSFSHDDYLAVAGGTQFCIGLEHVAAERVPADYLHVFPLRGMFGLAHGVNPSAPWIGLSLNGAPVGGSSYLALKETIASHRSKGGQAYIVIHHAMGHSLENIGHLVDAAGGACLWWLHDFFTFLQDPKDLIKVFQSGENAAVLLRDRKESAPEKERHKVSLAAFFDRHAVDLVAPSQFMGDMVRSALGVPYRSLRVHPHVRLEWRSQERQEREEGDASGPVRLAFVGAPVANKGWDVFRRLVEATAQRDDFEFYYFGSYDIDLDIPTRRVLVTGTDPLAMVRALRDARIDALLHLTLVPETFSLTAHEALAAGAGVVTGPWSGNVAALVEQTGRGLVLSDTQNLAERLERPEFRAWIAGIRSQRAHESVDVQFSRMSVDLLGLASELERSDPGTLPTI